LSSIKEGYNLNISRYISTATAEQEIKLKATNGKLVEIEKRIQDATRKHNEFLKELNQAPLPNRTREENEEGRNGIKGAPRFFQ